MSASRESLGRWSLIVSLWFGGCAVELSFRNALGFSLGGTLIGLAVGAKWWYRT